MDYGAKNTVETFQDNYNCSHIDLLFTRCLWYNLRREKCIVQFKKPSSVFLLKLSIPHDSLVHLLPSFNLSMVFVAEKTSCAFCILTFLISYCTYYTLHFFPTAPGFFIWKKKKKEVLYSYQALSTLFQHLKHFMGRWSQEFKFQMTPKFKPLDLSSLLWS